MALSRFFRDSGHLIRPALVLLAGVVIFLIIRAAVVPKDFGKHGHYRAGALDMIAALPVSYAGGSQCALCHDQEAKVHDGGKHAGVACEACYGPLPNMRTTPSPMCLSYPMQLTPAGTSTLRASALIPPAAASSGT